MYGIGYFYIMGGIITMGFVMMSVFLPVFHDLKLTSTYQVKSKCRKSACSDTCMLCVGWRRLEINR